MRSRIWLASILLLMPFMVAGKTLPEPAENAKDPYQPTPYMQIAHPQWTRDAVLYQMNTRQFTPEGTLRAAQAQLPRLKDLGVDILWLMPIHPIGVKNRKGSLGSPYSVRHYYAVNPELGTLQDLKAFVKAAHAQGMHVILDWVANHTAWDNPLVAQHPDWYERDWKGDFRPTPWWDWSDIIDLDYSKRDLRQYMTEAMAYWVREADIDGYRCDVAGFVPIEFWNNVRRELEAIKPGNIFMLAEWESRDLHAHAFDMTYAWTWFDAMHDIAHGRKDVNALYVYYSWNESAFPEGGQRMTFVTNHDKNAWDGTEYDLFGDARQAAIVLSFVGEGTPLIYNGQEVGNRKRLEFFERDPISWKDGDPQGALYRKLIALKTEQSALWNAPWGARMVHVPNSANSHVLSFVRQNAESKVFAVFNLSKQSQRVNFRETLFTDNYDDYFDGTTQRLAADTQLSLAPWEYKVFIQAK